MKQPCDKLSECPHRVPETDGNGCVNWGSKCAESAGTKFDTDKPRFDLIPPEVIFSIAETLTQGATKYGERNWEKGISYSRIFGAMMRHAWAWWMGEDIDPEANPPRSHLDAILINASFLVTYHRRGMTELDDRPLKNQ